MRRILLLLTTLLFAINFSYAQTFTEHNFKIQTVCALTSALNTIDGEDRINVYQCIDQSSSISIYRVNVITFKKQITNNETYLDKLKSDYSKLGPASFTTFKGQKAVQVIENVVIEGHSFKQYSISFLYKNKALTLVLVTNSSSAGALLEKCKTNFSLL
jgi:hypothetical protein